jgi:hypothetical protein
MSKPITKKTKKHDGETKDDTDGNTEPIKKRANRNICRQRYFKTKKTSIDDSEQKSVSKKYISFHEFKHFSLPKDRAAIIKEREELNLTCLTNEGSQAVFRYSTKKIPVKPLKKTVNQSSITDNLRNIVQTLSNVIHGPFRSTQRDVIVYENTFYDFLPANFQWPDKGEQRNFDYCKQIEKLLLFIDSAKFRVSFIVTAIEMMAKLKDVINGITGALNSIDRPMDALLHIVLKGKDFYNASCSDPAFCLYLIDNDAELCPVIWDNFWIMINDLDIPGIIENDEIQITYNNLNQIYEISDQIDFDNLE